jgi:hypothetical protein
MKHKKIGFLHLACGKSGRKGKRKISLEIEYENCAESFLLGVSMRLIFFFVGIGIEVGKKTKSSQMEVSHETDNDSVQRP